MNLEQMKYIVEVARTKSISTASHNLFVTQSALSQSISNLEIELGIKLFTRSRLGTIPTPEGKKIIKKAIEIVIKLQEIKEEAQGYSDIINSELRIVSIPVGMAPLVKTVTNFKCDNPQTTFKISQNSSKGIIQDIKDNKADLGLIATRYKLLQDEENISFEHFWEGKFVIGVSKNSPYASQKRISIKELLKVPLVLYEEEYVHEFVERLTDNVGPLNIMFTSNNAVAILFALEGGLAVTCGYDYSFINSPLVSNGDIVTLEISNYEQEPIIFSWVSSKNSSKTSVTKRFVRRFVTESQIGLI